MNLESSNLPNMDEILASKMGADLSQAISENSTSNSSNSDEVTLATTASTMLAQEQVVGKTKTTITNKPGKAKKDADKLNKKIKAITKSSKSKTIKKDKKLSKAPKLASKADKKTEVKNKTKKSIDKIKEINR